MTADIPSSDDRAVADVTIAPPSQRLLYLGVSFAMMVGHSALVSLPFEIGAIRDGLHLDTSHTGLLATAELVTFALTNVLLAPYVGGLSARRVSLAGSLLVAMACLVSAFTTLLPIFAVSRAAAGVGFGVMFASANVAGARAIVPERAYAIGLGVSTVFYSVMPLILARSGELFHLLPRVLLPHSGVFVAMAAFVLVMLPTMFFLPDRPPAAKGHRPNGEADTPTTLAIVASLLVMGCFAIAVFSPYTYIQLRAQAVGMTPNAIGYMLSAAIAIGLGGTVAAGWIGRRFGITTPLVLGLILQGMCCLVVSVGRTDTALAIAAIAYMVAWCFVYPYLFGLGAGIDPVGRLPTAIGGMYLIGASVATSIGGVLMQFKGYEAVGWSAFTLCGIAAAVAFPLARRIDARTRESVARSTAPVVGH